MSPIPDKHKPSKVIQVKRAVLDQLHHPRTSQFKPSSLGLNIRCCSALFFHHFLVALLSKDTSIYASNIFGKAIHGDNGRTLLLSQV